MDNDCTVCCEKYNKTLRKPIECGHCEYTACAKCCKTFIFSTINDAKCMNCSKIWDRDFLIKSFSYKFVNNEYKKHREKILFDIQVSKFEMTNAVIEKRNKQTKVIDEIKAIQDEIKELKRNLQEKYREKGLIYSEEVEEKKEKFFGHCTEEGCFGYINSQWCCSICNTKVCKSCKEKLTENHECNEEVLKNLKFIKKDTKNCPKCKINIYKISGCDMMWCTNCNIAFSWKNGEILRTSNIHNPHYFEWLYNRREDNEREDNGRMDNMCNIETFINIGFNITSVVRNRFKINNKNQMIYFQKMIINFYRFIRHIKFEASVLENTINDDRLYLEERIKYMTKHTTEKYFKRKIQIIEKKKNKSQEIYNIHDMFILTSGNYLLENIFDNNLTLRYENKTPLMEKMLKFKEFINKIFLHVNNLYENVNKIYKNKTPKIEKVLLDDTMDFNMV